MISHGPLTIDLTDLEQKLSTLQSSSPPNPSNASETSFQDVIDQDGSKFAGLLINIKSAYEDFVQGIMMQ